MTPEPRRVPETQARKSINSWNDELGLSESILYQVFDFGRKNIERFCGSVYSW